MIVKASKKDFYSGFITSTTSCPAQLFGVGSSLMSLARETQTSRNSATGYEYLVKFKVLHSLDSNLLVTLALKMSSCPQGPGPIWFWPWLDGTLPEYHQGPGGSEAIIQDPGRDVPPGLGSRTVTVSSELTSLHLLIPGYLLWLPSPLPLRVASQLASHLGLFL